MEYSIGYVLGGIAIVFNALGWAYAAQIYLRPGPHGWTWVSVVVGTLIVSVGVMFSTFVVLVHFGQLEKLWPLLFLDPAALVVVGGPMVVFQVIKKLREDKEADGNLDT
jgi:hypothetical protein